MTNNKKIWYPEEISKAIEDFYKNIKKGGEPKKAKAAKLNNVEVNNSTSQTISYNFPNISTLTTPQVGVLSLF